VGQELIATPREALRNGRGNATTADFIVLAQRDSHRNLRGVLERWLYTPGPVVTAQAAAAARQPAAAQALAARGHRRR
jgi:hypothetical protein